MEENEIKNANKNALNIVGALNEILDSHNIIDVDKDLISKLYSYLNE